MNKESAILSGEHKRTRRQSRLFSIDALDLPLAPKSSLPGHFLPSHPPYPTFPPTFKKHVAIFFGFCFNIVMPCTGDSMVLGLPIALELCDSLSSLPKPRLGSVSLYPGNTEQAKCTWSSDCFGSYSLYIPPNNAGSSGKWHEGEKKRNQRPQKAHH